MNKKIRAVRLQAITITASLVIAIVLGVAYQSTASSEKEIKEVAKQVINGVYGNGETRKRLLAEQGYNYQIVQDEVNRIIYSGESTSTSVETTQGSSRSSAIYSLRDLQYHGVINWQGKKFTYYSQSVLPGGGLKIPGRHVNSLGYVADGDGYIVLANDAPKGTVVNTPFGAQGKVYDRGTYGNHYDVYTK